MITLYNSRRFIKDRDLTDQSFRVIHRLSGALGRKRVMPIVLKDKKTQKRMLLLNIHANYNAPILPDMKVFMQLQKEHHIDCIMFAGDFNRNIDPALVTKGDNCQKGLAEAFKTRDKSLSDLQFASVPHTCMYYAAEGDLQIQTRDGVVCSKVLGPISTVPLWRGNQVEILDTQVDVSCPKGSQMTDEIAVALQKAQKTGGYGAEAATPAQVLSATSRPQEKRKASSQQSGSGLATKSGAGSAKRSRPATKESLLSVSGSPLLDQSKVTGHDNEAGSQISTSKYL